MLMELLTRNGVAEYLKISLRSADKLIQDKDFHGKKYIGRRLLNNKEKLDEYLENLQF